MAPEFLSPAISASVNPSNLAQNRIRPIPQFRRGFFVFYRCRGKQDRVGNTRHLNPVVAGEADLQAARQNLRVGEHLGDGVDRAAGHRCRLQGRDPGRCRAGFHRDGEQGRSRCSPILHPLAIAAEALVAGEFGNANDGAVFPELPVRAHRNDDVAIGRFKRLVGHDVGMRIAEPARNLAAHQIIRAPGWPARPPASRGAPDRDTALRPCAPGGRGRR